MAGAKRKGTPRVFNGIHFSALDTTFEPYECLPGIMLVPLAGAGNLEIWTFHFLRKTFFPWAMEVKSLVIHILYGKRKHALERSEGGISRQALRIRSDLSPYSRHVCRSCVRPSCRPLSCTTMHDFIGGLLRTFPAKVSCNLPIDSTALHCTRILGHCDFGYNKHYQVGLGSCSVDLRRFTTEQQSYRRTGTGIKPAKQRGRTNGLHPSDARYLLHLVPPFPPTYNSASELMGAVAV